MSKKIVDIKSEFENAAREEWQTLFEEYASDERSGVKNLIFSYQKKQIAYEKELLRLETMLAFEKNTEMNTSASVELTRQGADHWQARLSPGRLSSRKIVKYCISMIRRN